MDLRSLLIDSFLFRGLTPEEFESAINSVVCDVRSYDKGDIVCSPDSFLRMIGFVVSGECEVLRHGGGENSARINVIGCGGMFGVLGALSDDAEFPTTIKAKKATTILYLSRECLDGLIDKYPRIARNVIDFLASRIRFLNERIDTFSAVSVEQKLASYLLSRYRKTGMLEFEFNKLRVSKEIGVGRASLYRALTGFQELGLLAFDNKTLQIINIDEIERVSK